MTWFFEIYTKSPTGEPGWDIEVGFVLNVKTRTEAVTKIKNRYCGRFDEVIQCHESCLHPLGCKTVLIN